MSVAEAMSIRPPRWTHNVKTIDRAEILTDLLPRIVRLPSYSLLEDADPLQLEASSVETLIFIGRGPEISQGVQQKSVASPLSERSLFSLFLQEAWKRELREK